MQLKQSGVYDFNLNTWEMCVFHLWQAVLAFLSIKMSLTGAVSPRYFVLPEWDQSQIMSALIFNQYWDARGCQCCPHQGCNGSVPTLKIHGETSLLWAGTKSFALLCRGHKKPCCTDSSVSVLRYTWSCRENCSAPAFHPQILLLCSVPAELSREWHPRQPGCRNSDFRQSFHG